MVSLRKMTEAEFQSFLATSIPEYAAEKVKAGNWAPDEALAKSRETYASLLPEGLGSLHQHLYTIDSEGQPAGSLWLSTEPQGTANTGFIYDLQVDEAFRRRGIASEAMILLEQEALRLGLTSLALHVFAFNLPARTLYEKLGYEATNINMAKTITPQNPS